MEGRKGCRLAGGWEASWREMGMGRKGAHGGRIFRTGRGT